MALTPPALSFDPTDDFLFFDNLERVLYLSKQVGETFIDPEVPCLVRHGDVNEEELTGVEILVFHVRPVDLTYDAKPRDEIVRSDGSLWVVQSANNETFGVRYRLMATKARNNSGIDILIDDAGNPLSDDAGSLLTDS